MRSNNSASNPNAIAISAVGEWDWAIQNNGATNDTSYCFRMALDDGTPFGTYTNYPELTIEAGFQQMHFRWRNDDGGE